MWFMNGADIKQIRLEMGLTQTAFAELLGIAHRSTIRKYETGEHRISGTVAKLITLVWAMKHSEIYIDIITKRYMGMVQSKHPGSCIPFESIHRDLTKCHAVKPLRLYDLARASDDDLYQDVDGIVLHLNRKTWMLFGFNPKFGGPDES